MRRGIVFVLMLLLIGTGVISAQEEFEDPTGTIAYDEVVESTFDGEERQLWVFTGSATDLVTITMISEDITALDPLLELYFDGELLAENDDSRDPDIGGLNSRIEDFELPEDGEYIIAAGCFLPGECEGSYSLSLEVEFQAVLAEEEESDSPYDDGDSVAQWAISATGTSQFSDPSWGFVQATGEPDTFECGDISTAWASSSRDGQDELVLSYEYYVLPTEVNIYQTYNPGSIVRVTLSNSETGESYSVSVSDSETECPGVFTLEFSSNDVDYGINTVTIELDQSEIGNWNEIDAVELVGVYFDNIQPMTDDGADGDTMQIDFERVGSPDLAFSVTVPDGWEGETRDGSYFIGDTFENLSEADDVPISEDGIQIEFMLVYDYPDPDEFGSTPEEVVTVFVTFLNSDTEPESYDEVDVPAYILNPVGGSAPEDAILIVFESEAGLVAMAVRTDNFDLHQDAVNTIIESFTPYE